MGLEKPGIAELSLPVAGRGTGWTFPSHPSWDSLSWTQLGWGLKPLRCAGDVEVLLAKLEFTMGNMEKSGPAVQSGRGGGCGRSHLVQGMEKDTGISWGQVGFSVGCHGAVGETGIVLFHPASPETSPGSRTSLEYATQSL